MKFLLSALLLVLSVFPSFISAQQNDEFRPILFKMDTNKFFSMRGSFEGEYRILRDSIKLKITKGSILLADNVPYRGSRLLNHLGFGLAELAQDGKRFQVLTKNQSKALEIKKVMRPLDKHSFENVYFSIPRGEISDLSKVWIIGTMSADLLEQSEGISKSGYTYSHTCQNIFTLQKDNAFCVSRY